MKKFALFILTGLLLLLAVLVQAQETTKNIDLVAGVSVPELYHGGIRYHYNPNARLDFNFGTNFENRDNDRLYSYTLNHAYYFGKINEKTSQKSWSVNTGFSLLTEKDKYDKLTHAIFNLYLAKEFPITKKLFIQPELGASYLLFEHSSDPDYFSSGYQIRLIPKFGLNLILKI